MPNPKSGTVTPDVGKAALAAALQMNKTSTESQTRPVHFKGRFCIELLLSFTPESMDGLYCAVAMRFQHGNPFARFSHGLWDGCIEGKS